MTPLQKALVVAMIKGGVKPEPVTAAIGDGANDVSMIQEAHLGIGLYGKEGRQAVRASDYALGRFRFLRPALFLHGHYFYVRLATLVQYFFYKNVAFVTAEFWYAIFSGFSATTIYDSFFLTFYNVTFTSLPIIFFGLFEQHLDRDLLIKRPELYRKISQNADLNWRNFILWNMSGLWHSLVSYFGVHILVAGNEGVLGGDGNVIDMFAMGMIMCFIVFLTVTLKLLYWSFYFTWATVFCLVFTYVGNLTLLALYNGFVWPTFLMTATNMLWLFFDTFAYPNVWLTILLLVVLSLLPDVIFRAMQNQIEKKETPRVSCANFPFICVKSKNGFFWMTLIDTE